MTRWLTAMAAVLGVSEACHRHESPVAAREVAPLASTSASAEPSATATVEAVAPSASASAAPSAIASIKPAPTMSEIEQQQMLAVLSGNALTNDAGLGSLLRAPPGRAACGATVRSVCGLSDPGMHMNPTSRAPVAQVNATITNGIAGDDRIVASLRPRFRACANHGLTQDPNMEGKVVVVVQIQPNGEVTSAVVTSNNGISAQTAACMTNALKNAQFGTNAARRNVGVSITQTKQ